MKDALKLVSMSEVQTAKDNRQFFVGTFSPGFGQLKVKRIMWEQFIRDSKTGLPTDKKQWERGTPAEAKVLIASGELIEGKKVTHKVAPYVLGTGENARTVDTYSTVVFADENEITVFANANHPILDESTGQLLGAKNPILASNRPDGAVGEEASKVLDNASIEEEAK